MAVFVPETLSWLGDQRKCRGVAQELVALSHFELVAPPLATWSGAGMAFGLSEVACFLSVLISNYGIALYVANVVPFAPFLSLRLNVFYDSQWSSQAANLKSLTKGSMRF